MDDDDTRDPDWQPGFDDEDESYIPPVPALPSLDEIHLNPDHDFETDLHLLVSFNFFLRIQSEFGNYVLLYIYFGHLTNNIFKHAEELQQ